MTFGLTRFVFAGQFWKKLSRGPVIEVAAVEIERARNEIRVKKVSSNLKLVWNFPYTFASTWLEGGH